MSKLSNEYADVIFIDDMPKSVLAAIVVSLISCGGDWLDTPENILAIRSRIAFEWQSLYMCGVVPQKPRGKMTEFLRDELVEVQG